MQYVNVRNDIQDKLYEFAGNNKNITLGVLYSMCVT